MFAALPFPVYPVTVRRNNNKVDKEHQIIGEGKLVVHNKSIVVV
jgi:hypothetical protein